MGTSLPNLANGAGEEDNGLWVLQLPGKLYLETCWNSFTIQFKQAHVAVNLPCQLAWV